MYWLSLLATPGTLLWKREDGVAGAWLVLQSYEYGIHVMKVAAKRLTNGVCWIELSQDKRDWWQQITISDANGWWTQDLEELLEQQPSS